MKPNPLTDRVREHLRSAGSEPTELRMFGGIAFTVGGHMAVAASDRGLLVRTGPEAYDEALGREGADAMVMRGRPMLGWVRVAHKALEDQE